MKKKGEGPASKGRGELTEGRSGGIVSIWNSDKFYVISSWHMEGAVIVNAILIPSGGVQKEWGMRAQYGRSDIGAFDGFIRNTSLIDLPLQGCTYTWYRLNGSCKSHLDRVLINNEWMNMWPSVYQKGLKRSISYHCPIILETKGKDCGTKLFRWINAWSSHPKYKAFVEEKWKSYAITGWGGFVLKEKLKRLKVDLKQWNMEEFGVLERRIENRRAEI
ncbi:hypothetical protein ACS0TY_021043 [Phlomoides rotata]